MKSFLTLFAALVCSIGFCQDIILVEATGPKSLLQREEFVQSFVIKNAGIVAVGEFSSNFYLSADDKIDASDFTIGGKYLSGLAAGASTTIQLPNGYVGVAPGAYNVIAKLDAYNYVTETDEANNTVALSGYTVSSPDYDLRLTSFATDKSVYPARSRIRVSCSMQNAGTTNLGGIVDVEFYISNDAVWDASDTEIGRDFDDMGSPDTHTFPQIEFRVPDKTPGSYYLIARLDNDNKIPETNESNNTSVLPITITAGNFDLEIQSLVANSGALEMMVRNNGTTPVFVESYEVYGFGGSMDGNVSVSVSFNYGDFPLYIQPGETVTLLGSIYTPEPVSGNYFLTVFLSIPGDANTGNDNASTSFYVSPPPVKSARFVSLTPVGSYDNTDQSLDFQLVVENNGNASYFYQDYTLSIKDGSQNEIYSKDFYVFLYLPGESETQVVTATLTTPLPAGDYTVDVRCQSGCNTSPTSITTSIAISPIEHTLTGTVVGEDGVPLTNGKLFLYQKGDDGVLRFVQKVTPAASAFSFGIDTHEHTLYYVPDVATESEYVPTVYGKTITLESTSLFTLTGDNDFVFEIIKIQPLATGTGIISGYVSSGSQAQTMSMRVATAFAAQSTETPEASVPVMLLSSGAVVRLTYSDANGYYEFRNLPRQEFEVIVTRELDQAVMDEPHPVDITTQNKNVNFDLTAEDAAPSESVLMLQQTVSFTTVANAQYGDSPIALIATSDSGLPITFESSDATIGEITASTLTIRKPGTVVLTAKQNGDNFYDPALSTQTIQVAKADQVVSMEDIPSLKYGDAALPLSASTNAGLPVSFQTSDTSIAEVDGTTLVVKKPGSVTITARQGGDNYYNEALVEKSIVIAKAERLVSLAEIPQKHFGDAPFVPETSGAIQTLTLHSSNPEVAAIEDGKIVIRKPGIVTITASAAEDDFYLSSTDSKQLSIAKGNHGLTFPSISDKTYGDNAFLAGAASASSRSIIYSSSDNSIAEVVDGLVTIGRPGTITLTASQSEDEFYNASAASQTFVVKKAAQLISVPEFPQKRYGDPAFPIGATSTSNLPLEVSVSDESIVKFVFNNLLIRNAGTVVITIQQHGNDFYEAAAPVQKTLTVSKASQSIVFSDLPAKEVSDASFTLVASINSPLKLQFISDNENVATIKGNVVTLRGAGTANITAIQPGDGNYSAATPVTRTLSVGHVTDIEDMSNAISVYPNPVHDFLQIDGNDIIAIQLVDALGRNQKDYNFTDNTVDVREVVPGVYFLIIFQDSGKKTIRIVKY